MKTLAAIVASLSAILLVAGCSHSTARVKVSDARFDGPRVVFKAHNSTGQAINALSVVIAIQEPGRTVPLDSREDTFDVPGGIEPGETKDVYWAFYDDEWFLYSLSKHKSVPVTVAVTTAWFTDGRGNTSMRSVSTTAASIKREPERKGLRRD